MSGDAETQRIIGQLQATTTSFGDRATRLETQMGTLEAKLDKVIEQNATARGGLKTLVAVGSVAGSIGAGITALLNLARHP